MVVTSDLVTDVKDIHPVRKKEVAARLANIALAETYGQQGIVWKSPTFKSMVVEKDKARVSFHDADKGLVSKGEPITGFYVAGADGRYYPASAKIDKNNTVLVWSKEVKTPATVRFGFTNTDMPNLFSTEGLPVNLFRTDTINR
jgi:sialate O-acetylesterase